MEESNGWRVVKVSQTISKALLCFLLIWFCSNNEEKQAFRSKHFFEGTLGVENSLLFQQVMDKTRLKHIKPQNNIKHFRNPPRWGQSTLNRIHGWGNIALLSMQFLARLGWISQPTPPTPSLTTLRLKSAPPSIEGLTLPRIYLTWTQTSRILQILWSPCATAPPRHVHVSRPKQRWRKSWFLILVKDTVTTLTTLNLPDKTCWSVIHKT